MIVSQDYNVCYGLDKPDEIVETICTLTENKGIKSVDATDSDGNHYTIWYADVVTRYINEEKLAELERTSLEHDELIAELLEGDAV